MLWGVLSYEVCLVVLLSGLPNALPPLSGAHN